MINKNCCPSHMVESVLRVEGSEIHYSGCSECGSIWLDRDVVRDLDLNYDQKLKSGISDFRCPRCRDMFLEYIVTPDNEPDVCQCRKCNGIRLESGHVGRSQEEKPIENSFGYFLRSLNAVFNRELNMKKSTKLPSGFKIKNSIKTDYKCPACKSLLSDYSVYESDESKCTDLDICDNCFGIWLDKDDMISSGNKKGKKLHVDFDNIIPTERTCPKCKNIKLVSLKYKELETLIDCCPDCYGTWLDGGELYEFANYLKIDGQEIIDVLVDNALFKDVKLIRVLKQFARTLHNVESRNREQEDNLDQAREIQEKLIYGEKDVNSSIPLELSGYSVISHWIPAKVVGGDYFAVIPFEHQSKKLIGLCIADVSGKGLPASLLMANLQALLISFAPYTDSPAELCNKLNTILHNFTTSNKFITFFYGVLNPETGILKYCNGGHNPPVFLSNGRINWLKTGGSVLSFFPKWDYQEGKIELNRGDRVLFYTDGVSETENPSKEEFGEARIAAHLKKYGNKKIKDTMQFLVRDIKEYNQGHYNDDTTLMLLERSV